MRVGRARTHAAVGGERSGGSAVLRAGASSVGGHVRGGQRARLR